MDCDSVSRIRLATLAIFALFFALTNAFVEAQSGTTSLVMPIPLDDLQTITPENVGQLLELAEFRHYNEHGVSQRPDSLDFNPDGTRLVSGYSDGSLRLWDVANGQELVFRSGYGYGRVQGVVFSPDGDRIASWGPKYEEGVYAWRANTLIHLWEANTLAEQTALELPSWILGVVFRSEGNVIALEQSPFDPYVRLWDGETGEQIWERQIENDFHGQKISPDGTRFASTDGKGSVYVWNTATGERILTVTGYERGIGIYLYAFSNDSTLLATGTSFDVDIWDVATGKKLTELEGAQRTIMTAAFSPTATLLATGDGQMRDVQTGASVFHFGDSPISFKFNREGTLLAVIFQSGYVGGVRLYGIPGCVIIAPQAVNLREGPGTSYGIQASLPVHSLGFVDGQATDANGETWWRLTNGLWAFSKIVEESGMDCGNVPEAETND